MLLETGLTASGVYIPVKNYHRTNLFGDAHFTMNLPQGSALLDCVNHKPIKAFFSKAFIPLKIKAKGEEKIHTVYVKLDTIRTIAEKQFIQLEFPTKIQDEHAAGELATNALARAVQTATMEAEHVKAATFIINNLDVLCREGCRANPFSDVMIDRAWCNIYHDFLCDLYAKNMQACDNLASIKTIDLFTQKITVSQSMDSSDAVVVQIEQSEPHNNFQALQMTKGSPEKEYLFETQKRAIRAYMLSVGEMLILKIPQFPLERTSGKSKAIKIRRRPDLPNDMRYNQQLKTGGGVFLVQEGIDKAFLSYHHSFASGYPREEYRAIHEKQPNHPDLRLADFCLQYSLRIGDIPAWISCHVDGSGQGSHPADFARQFCETFVEGLTRYLEEVPITESREQARAVMVGLAYAQHETMSMEKCHAPGTLLASLTMKDPLGLWQQVAVAVGDVDLVRLRPDGKVYIPTIGARHEPLEVRYPGGQMGVNRKCGYLPDFSNMRLILSPQLQPNERMVSFSDGVMDNLYPYAFHTCPRDAIAEVKAEGSFAHLVDMDQFTRLDKCTADQSKELLELYKAYLCFKLAEIDKNSQKPGTLSAFIDGVIVLAQQRAITKTENHPDKSMGVGINALGHIVKSDDLSGAGIQFADEAD